MQTHKEIFPSLIILGLVILTDGLLAINWNQAPIIGIFGTLLGAFSFPCILYLLLRRKNWGVAVSIVITGLMLFSSIKGEWSGLRVHAESSQMHWMSFVIYTLFAAALVLTTYLNYRTDNV